jgi:hypothetical protein
MNVAVTALEKPSRVRYGVLGFACSLSMITYLDRVCFGTVASNIQSEFGLSESQKGWLFSFSFRCRNNHSNHVHALPETEGSCTMKVPRLLFQ